jgi:hypothetical protein
VPTRIIVHGPLPPPDDDDPFVVYVAAAVTPLPPPDPDDPFVVYLRGPSDLEDVDLRRELMDPIADRPDRQTRSLSIVFESSEGATQLDLAAVRDVGDTTGVASIELHAERQD